jgi:hypothetical protein
MEHPELRQITNNVRLQDATLQQLLVDYQNLVLVAQQQVADGISTFIQSQYQAEYLRRSADAPMEHPDLQLCSTRRGRRISRPCSPLSKIYSKRKAIWPRRAATSRSAPRSSIVRLAVDGRLGSTAISSRRKRATRCARVLTGVICCRLRVSRSRRSPVCHRRRTSGLQCGFPNGKVNLLH